jgi:alkylation response protein AidB-like acyl-CoA dehydrogenase
MVARVALVADNAPAGDLTQLAMALAPLTVNDARAAAPELGELALSRPVSTRDRWEALATLGARDLGVARVIEPHLDALAILTQARDASAGTGHTSGNSVWGVFAAEGGDDPLLATEGPDGWRLTGTKPWCSLADRLDRALVTAHLEEGGRGLFEVDLSGRGLAVVANTWAARGLAEIPSGPVTFLDVAAVPVGESDWYLRRPGFAVGGIGVAACWFGGAIAVARTVFEVVGPRPAPIHAMQLGKLDGMVQSARLALADAARLLDADAVPDAEPKSGSILAKRVRAAVALACEDILQLAGHALGPAPLAMNASHAKRVADLQLYIRQHHAEKDDASLGEALAGSEVSPW